MPYDTPESRASLRDSLATRILEIRFRKANGTERTLLCTRNEDYIRQAGWMPRDGSPTAELSETVLPVWDVHLDEWRSFRYDSIVDCFTKFVL